MMQFDPCLIITRLRVERNTTAVYDEKFHQGLNVIRGENSSGKSTLLNFIFYGLGGDLADWSEAALLCSRVIIEASFNGKSATLSREISKETGQPMEIFGGAMDLALLAPRPEWVRYPYRRSAAKESFSQALFRLLHMPEVANEVSGSLTMHQILRLLYSDQLSPVEKIFKFEPFDPPALREVIGRLLCGAYDSRLYENELKLRTLNRDFDSANAELRSLISVLGKANESMTLEWINAQRATLHGRRVALQDQIGEAEKRLFDAKNEDTLTLAAQETAYSEVQKLQGLIGDARDKRDSMAFSMADSAAFIVSQQQKLKALSDAQSVVNFVGEIHFETCPVCFAELDKKSDHQDSCRLCKTPFEAARAKARIVALINDTALQLRQSLALQEHRSEEVAKLSDQISKLQDQWKHASTRLAELRRLPSGEIQDILRALQRQVGYLEREGEDLESKAALAQMVDQLSRRKADLNARISLIKSENEAMLAGQSNRLHRAYTAVADEVRTLLKNDLRRQDSFENPQSIQFDFADNTISVDGHSYFSASSRVILKSSFFAGFLAAATKQDYFRHPRFCMIDTIEDKGMEVERSHNFQLQLLRISKEAKVEHQIIYATAMIVPDVDEPQYTVGKYSTRDDFSLAVEV